MIYSIGVICLCLIALLTRVNKKTLLVLTFLFLTGIAILFEPQAGLDLYKHYQTLDVMREIGYVNSVARFHFQMQNLPVYSAFFYLVSLLRYDKLLLIITYLVVYGCMFGVLSMSVEDHGWSQKSWNLGYVIVMLVTNAYSVTGIRYTLSFAVVFLFMYIDLVRKQHRIISLVVYVLMCLLHDGMLPIVLLRFLLYIPSNRVTSKLKYLLVFWQVWLTAIENLLRMIPNDFFSSVADKLMLYTTSESANMWVSGVGMETLATMRLIILCVTLIFYFMSKSRHEDNYQKMLILLILFCFGGISKAALIDRYTNAELLFSIPFMLEINGESNYDNERNRFLIKLQFLPMLVLILLYFISLVLYQYQYFL